MVNTNSSDFWARTKFVLNEAVSEVTNRDWRLPPRPWNEFVERFSVPKFAKNTKNVTNRITLNLSYYQTNYLTLYAAVFILFLVRHPWSIFEVGAISTGWVYATSARPVVIRGRRITRKEKFGIMTALAFILPIATGVMVPLTLYVLAATAGVLLHAAFRHTSVRHKVSEIRAPGNDKW